MSTDDRAPIKTAPKIDHDFGPIFPECFLLEQEAKFLRFEKPKESPPQALLRKEWKRPMTSEEYAAAIGIIDRTKHVTPEIEELLDWLLFSHSVWGSESAREPQ